MTNNYYSSILHLFFSADACRGILFQDRFLCIARPVIPLQPCCIGAKRGWGCSNFLGIPHGRRNNIIEALSENKQDYLLHVAGSFGTVNDTKSQIPANQRTKSSAEAVPKPYKSSIGFSSLNSRQRMAPTGQWKPLHVRWRLLASCHQVDRPCVGIVIFFYRRGRPTTEQEKDIPSESINILQA